MSALPMESPVSCHCAHQVTELSNPSVPSPCSVATEQTKAKLRRPQASLGLGIITANLDKPSQVMPQPSKTNAFFSTSSDLPTPRPPPPLVRRSLEPLATPSVRIESDEMLGRRASLATRLRSLVASTKSGAVSPAPSPIPNALGRSGTEVKATSLSSSPTASPSPLPPSKATSTHRNSFGYSYYAEDDIMPLPTPTPASLPSTNSPVDTSLPTSFSHFSSVTTHDKPSSPTCSRTNVIPIIAHSALFPMEKNKLPSLSEAPILGDIDDLKRMPDNHHLMLPITREAKVASPLPHRPSEEDMSGKQLGDFSVRHLLGVGAFSKVYLADKGDSSSPSQFAIKVISKTKIINDARIRSSIEREVGVLKCIDHPAIIKLVAAMETEEHLCIVMEYARGGELFSFVQQLHAEQEHGVDETLVKAIFLELVKVVEWMHMHNVVHRDLKLENILIDKDANGHPRVKVIDFGLARVVDPYEPVLTTRCGSEEYAAPEIVQGLGYDGRQTDTWALGIILYALLVGYLPFTHNAAKGERVSHLFYRIVSAQVKWPVDWIDHPSRAVSPEARHVVEHILVRNPAKRIKLAEIPNLPWFTTSHSK